MPSCLSKRRTQGFQARRQEGREAVVTKVMGPEITPEPEPAQPVAEPEPVATVPQEAPAEPATAASDAPKETT